MTVRKKMTKAMRKIRVVCRKGGFLFFLSSFVKTLEGEKEK